MNAFFLNVKRIIPIFMVVVLLSGCLENDDEPINVPDVAYVSLYHASPNVGDLDIILDEKVINTQAFEYSEYSGYLNFTPGVRELALHPYDKVDSLTGGKFTFDVDKSYSFFFVGTEDNLELIRTEDNGIGDIGTNAAVRFVQVSPGEAGLTLRIKNDPDNPIFTDRIFKTFTSFTEIDEESVVFEIVDTEGEILATSQNVHFTAGRYYTVIAKGFVTPPTDDDPELEIDVIRN